MCLFQASLNLDSSAWLAKRHKAFIQNTSLSFPLSSPSPSLFPPLSLFSSPFSDFPPFTFSSPLLLLSSSSSSPLLSSSPPLLPFFPYSCSLFLSCLSSFSPLFPSLFRRALKRAKLLLSMKHGLARLDNVWGMGGGQRPVMFLISKVC